MREIVMKDNKTSPIFRQNALIKNNGGKMIKGGGSGEKNVSLISRLVPYVNVPGHPIINHGVESVREERGVMIKQAVRVTVISDG